MELFEIEFLQEALEFLDEIPIKAKDKILFNMAMARSKKDPKLFNLCKMEFGTSEQNILATTTEFLHFGTRQIKLTPW